MPFVDALLDDLKPVFRLHTLELGPATNSPSLVSSLFETSSSTLSILYLHDLDPSLDPILLSSLPLVANNLTTLNIVGLSLFSTFGPTFSTFNSLTEIGTSLGTLPDLDALDSLLAALDPPLAALRLIFFPAPFREEGVLEGVTNRMGKDGWMGFQRAFVPERLDDLFADPGGPGFFKQCVEMEVMIGTEDFAETYMYKV